MIVVIEKVLENLSSVFDLELKNDPRSIASIYLYSSYARNDFVVGRSDIDFAVFLDLPKDSEHWVHPDFVFIQNIIHEGFKSIPKDTFRRDTTFSGIDIISFTLYELEQTINNQISELVGPLRNLTFFSFDFLTNNRLLWGKDVVKQITTIPDPHQYKTQRLQWIKKQYLRKNKKDEKSGLLVTLGSIIRHYAVLHGIRDLKKSVLKEWTIGYKDWPKNINVKFVMQKYFEFITNNTYTIEYLDNIWVEEAKKLLDKFLK